MITFLLCGFALGWVYGNWRGQERGWTDAIKVACAWEGIGRDWRMLYDLELADTDTERAAIREVRELNKMYDGV